MPSLASMMFLAPAPALASSPVRPAGANDPPPNLDRWVGLLRTIQITCPVVGFGLGATQLFGSTTFLLVTFAGLLFLASRVSPGSSSPGRGRPRACTATVIRAADILRGVDASGLELGGHVRPTQVPGVPEVTLLLADDVFSVWQDGDELPFWAFAWPGGQVLARWLLDHRELVAGRDVVDLGCASGLVGIAAALAGARSVLCIDVDAAATAAASANAELNGVAVEVRRADVLDEPAEADVNGRVVLAGDLLYECALAVRSTAWLRRQAAAGAWALAGDAERSYAPTDGIRVLAEFDIETHAGIERGATASVRVLEILPLP